MPRDDRICRYLSDIQTIISTELFGGASSRSVGAAFDGVTHRGQLRTQSLSYRDLINHADKVIHIDHRVIA